MLKRFVFGGLALAAMLAAVLLANGGRPAAASAGVDPVEQEFLDLLNDYRAQNGLGPLIIDSSIQNAAEWMSTDMGEQDYFSHTDSLGRSPWDRMCDFNYCYNTWKGENIAAGYSTAESVFQAWKASPGHNSNMLGANYEVMGIARVYTSGSTYGYYWTNDFGGYVVEPSPPPAPTSTPSPTPTPPPPTATPSPTPSPSPSPSPPATATPSPATPSPTPQTSYTPTPTATPQPTDTPTQPAPSATATATPTPAGPQPTASPSPEDGFAPADVNCDGYVDPADALVLLRHAGGLPVNTPEGCPLIGHMNDGTLSVFGVPRLHGDVDCNWRVDAADALGVLRSAGHVGAADLGAC